MDALRLVREMPDISELDGEHGKMWSWRDGLVIIEPAFTAGGDVVYSGRMRALGAPRCCTGRHEAFLALADLLMGLGIRAVCGPVLSGAQMAYAVALLSNNEIMAKFLPKPGYAPRKHYGRLTLEGPYAIIDDIVDTGEAMMESMEAAEAVAKCPPAMIVANTWSPITPGGNLSFLDPLKGRLFTATM